MCVCVGGGWGKAVTFVIDCILYTNIIEVVTVRFAVHGHTVDVEMFATMYCYCPFVMSH